MSNRRGGGGARGGRSRTSRVADADRSLRQKGEHRYVDGLDSDSDDELGLGGAKHGFNVQEKLTSAKFPMYFVKELAGEEINLAYFQETGFGTPLLAKQKSGLGITAPDTFTVTDVKNAVGARRTIDVMDCTTQKNSAMTMKDWEDYYNDPNRDDARKLNVISLEFSFTKLEPFVIAPKVVRQIDWTDNVWPRHLKEQQTEGTNDMYQMKYPKVQKYCLMSVAGCYTDFHIDFGGTSVWYHIVKGGKVFWLIPPTENNLKLYEQWTLSGKQSDVFFGDLVDKCGRVTLEAGNTFFIPSGWIHAVYTPHDSLVFGGNFLHSFAIEKQIRIAQIEEVTKVPQKFRFPFFTELQWYALDKYVYHLFGRTHIIFEDEEIRFRLLGSDDEQKLMARALELHPHITPQEIFGLKAIVMYIHALPVSKKNVPPLIPAPIELVRDVREMVNLHKKDDPHMAVTGRPLLHWPGIKNDPGFMRVGGKLPRSRKSDPEKLGGKRRSGGTTKRNERMPCKICQACLSPDCGKCMYCADMPKYGGQGRSRQPCHMRQCLQPLLSLSLLCSICGLDGWYADSNLRLVERPAGTCSLMECAICNEVTHPTCMTDVGEEGYIKMELPNSWECPKCVKSGLAVKLEPNIVLPPPTMAADGITPTKQIKLEPTAEELQDKKPMAYGSDSTFTGHQLFNVTGKSGQSKQELRTQLATQILSASTHPQKEPSYIFRPPPSTLSAEEIYDRIHAKEDVNLRMEQGVMLEVFKRLNTDELSKCVRVCKTWNKIAQDPALWDSVRFEGKKITSRFLSLIVQRQPVRLVLDWSTVSKQQLSWLLPRIPQTRSLSMAGLEYSTSVISLNTVNTPMLQELDLSYVTNFNDMSLFKLLSSPKDSRPGLLDKKTRMKLLKKLSLSGTEISDVGIRYVSQFLTQLATLHISNCWKITDAGLAQLSIADSKIAETLESLDVSRCGQVTNAGLTHLSKCKELSRVNCTGSAVTVDAMKKFVGECKERNLKVVGHVIERRLTRK